MMKPAATAAHKRSADAAFPITVSKETTWITEPLYPNGAVNYVAALNGRLSEGVTPDNNAAALLMQVMGAKEIPKEIRPGFYQHLGIPVPENPQGDLQPYGDFLDEYLRTTGGTAKKTERRKLMEKSFQTYGRPWTRKEYPLVARWLDANEQAIDRIVAASRRPRLYVPIVPEDQENGLLDVMLFGFTSNVREFARILDSRAMLSIGEGRIEDAQRDLLACHRLGHLMGNGSSIMNYLVGVALDAVARDGDLFLTESAHATPTQLANYRSEIGKLPTFASMSEMYDLSERYGFLDIVRILVLESRKPEAAETNVAVEVGEFLDLPPSQSMETVPGFGIGLGFDPENRQPPIQPGGESTQAADFPKAESGPSDKIKDEVMQLRKESQDRREVALLVWRKKPAREIISRQFGNELAWMMLENSEMFAEVEVRVGMKRQMLLIALALAEYQREHGEYPSELSVLAPKYLSGIPLDAFSLKPLKYKPRKEGYLLYCVGSNGEDDKGDTDDVAIRVPHERG